MKKKNKVLQIIFATIKNHLWLSLGIILMVLMSVVISLLPPLVLGNAVDKITAGKELSWTLILCYFAFLALSGITESIKESLLIIFGQKTTHILRSNLSKKLSCLSAGELSKQQSGAITARFVGDVNTIEKLFTSGIVSMVTEICKIAGILVILWTKTKGLAIIMMFVLPLVFWFTRIVQKKTLDAQMANRLAISRATNHIPESLRCIRTIHTLGKEKYMENKYDEYLDESYEAKEKTHFFDSIYSPAILILNTVIVAVVMMLSASGNLRILNFFGMSAGTAVAVINYIGKTFEPIENIGMEIQTVQSAIAGVKRINNFLNQSERTIPQDNYEMTLPVRCVELRDVSFGYDETTVLDHVNFSINSGEQVIIAGRTGAGKSTIFKLLLGLYEPQSGRVLIDGIDASHISESDKRKIFGYVDQNFHMVPGTIKDQITLFDPSITEDMVYKATKLVGIHDTICNLEHGYQTKCSVSLFSQGQWQLLAIARAAVNQPSIFLLDEITANLDAETENAVLTAIQNISADKTVISISHRFLQHTVGRIIKI